MATRFVYTQPTTFYYGSGLKVSRSDEPSRMATQLFLNGLLEDMVVKVNPTRKHKCTSLCGHPVYVHLGFPNNRNVKSACPDASKALIEDFEDLLAVFLFENEERAEIQSIGLRILPCSKVLEIIDSAIFL